VQDRGNLDEMTRLDIQDKMLTTAMGGVLPELTDPSSLQSVLDVGCGTGGWLMETARSYPAIKRLVGADISTQMMEFARARAKAQQLDGRVQFQTMDALRILEFPEASFDLVNQRLGQSWLRTWEWKKILMEYTRVCRPGGIVRIAESNTNGEYNSPALEKLNNIALEVFYNSGRLWTLSSDGLTSQLVRLLTEHGLLDVKSRVQTLVYRAGEASGQSFYEDTARLFRLFLPFFQKWTRIPSDYDEIYQQALKEMQQPDFVARWTWVTAWGTKSTDGNPMLMRGLM
jgi:ubiquinone/menaquinone biosynthesis C-methylase UbiE